MCNSKVRCPRCNGNGYTEFTNICDGICFLCSGGGLVNSSVYKKEQKTIQEKIAIKKAQEEERKEEAQKAYAKALPLLIAYNKSLFLEAICNQPFAFKYSEKLQRQLEGMADAYGLKNPTKNEFLDFIETFFKRDRAFNEVQIARFAYMRYKIDYLGFENDGKKFERFTLKTDGRSSFREFLK